MKIKTLAAILAIALSNSIIAEELIFEESFASPSSLKSWTQQFSKVSAVQGEGVEIQVGKEIDHKGLCGIFHSLPVEKMRGRQIQFSVETKGDELTPGPNSQHFHGVDIQLSFARHGGQASHAGPNGKKYGSYPWESASFQAKIPEDAVSASVSLGLQNTFGTASFRKLKIAAGDRLLSLRQVANMGFADETAGDGKGGWSDQGRDNDARNFNFGKELYGNVPFDIADPAKNDGKAVMAFRSPHMLSGLQSATLTIGKAPANAKYLYLLHTLCWGEAGPAGKIELESAGGKVQRIDVAGGKDVADWWSVQRLPNAWPGAAWTTGGTSAGLFVSKFKLDFVPAKIVFSASGGDAVWIVVGATLSEKEYAPLESADFQIAEGKDWKPLLRTESPCIAPGSALDLSALGKLPIERVIVNADGHLVLSGAPEKAVRFFCASANPGGRPGMMKSNFDSKEDIELYVKEIRRNGYNMFRMHLPSMTAGGMRDGKIELNAEWVDKLDFFIAKLKENGVFMMTDCDGGEVGYTGANPWRDSGKLGLGFKIYFDEKTREQFKDGVTQFFGHVNPYTKTRLVEDPVLASLTFHNEHEFAFIKEHDWKIAAPEWREFLRGKYGDIKKLDEAWGANYASFDGIEPFDLKAIAEKSRRGADLDEFIAMKERWLMDWKTQFIRELGYKGLYTNFDMTKSFHYNALRAELPLVMMHTYHTHPAGFLSRAETSKGTIGQASALQGASGYFRDTVATRIAGKPFFVNEYAMFFWNNYRYEEAFSFSAYAALNGFDGLMHHSHPLNISNAEHMFPWECFWDPIIAAQQVETAFLFLRGDVKESDSSVRIQFSEKAMREALLHRDAVNGAQSRLALIAKLGMERVDGVKSAPPGAKEMAIPVSGASAVQNNVIGFSSIIEKGGDAFELSKRVDEMKAKGLIAKSNGSSGWSLFESSTGELFLDANKKFMSVDAPRFQGICGEAGASAKLGALTVERLGVDGNASVIALNGDLKTATRLLLVFATNAMNSGMAFEDASMTVLKKVGGNPTLLRTGELSIRLKNANAGNLRVWALAMNGARRDEIRPSSTKDGELALRVDTAALPSGPTPFFELSAE